MGRTGFGRDKLKPWTYVYSKHFIGGKRPTQEHSDPIPALDSHDQYFPEGKRRKRLRGPVPGGRIASKTRQPKSKRRKTVKRTIRSGKLNKNVADQQGTSGASVQALTLGPAGQNIVHKRQNVSAPVVILKRCQTATNRRREQLKTNRDKKCSDASVLRLSDINHLDFGTNATIFPQDVRNMFVKQMLVIKMEPPGQQNWSPGLDEEDQKPPQIKEEMEEVDITSFIFSPDPVKSEDEEEKPQPSKLHHSCNKESVGSDPKDETLESSEKNVSDGNWEESSECKSEVFPLEIKEESSGDVRNDRSKEDQKPPQIKEEQGEGDVNIFSPVPVKSEDNEEEEKPQSSDLHHSWSNESTDSVGSGPDEYLEDNTLDSSETDVSDGNWEESSESESDLFSVEMNEVSGGDKRNEGPKRTHTGEKPFSCSICVQCFRYGKILSSHKDIHDDLAFWCNICNEGFGQKCFFVTHMKIHTG